MIEWLALMQHHGAPTRLLDFTYSLYVAAYFALEEAEGESAVWAINAPWVLEKSITALELGGRTNARDLYDEVSPENEHERFSTLFDTRVPKSVTPLNPFRINERQRIQKGVFLVPGDITVPFMENLMSLPGSENESNVLKLVFAPAARIDALKQLYYMTISRTNLFPGLDGYARSLGVYHSIFNPMPWAK
jgi:hypothetical protein